MIDTDRRKRVMQRSIKLGHCICNPKQPCPCEQFKKENICSCAGERLDSPSGKVRLTQLVDKPGCASKIDQAFLKEVLRGLPSSDDPRVLVGVAAGDDAGVYDLGDGQALVQTVDVFTPSVDDPYLFGQVAAANSVSDIYAMGGKPITALSVIGFPMRKIPDSAMKDILRGGIDKMSEAGVAIIGGHSINDDQVKAGFAVTGLIDKTRIITNAGAKAGDVLILTKPLGTGIVAFAGQIGKASDENLKAAGQSMAALNRTASELMLQFDAHACTDVTGFSLMGHLAEVARSSGVDVELIWDDIPLLPGVLEYAAAGILPGAVERNRGSCGGQIDADASLPSEMVDICYDAQTSGGLLVVVPPESAESLLDALHHRGMKLSAIVGEVTGNGTGRIHLKATGTRQIPSASQPPVQEVACCANAIQSEAVGGEMDPVWAKYRDFLSAAGSPHNLDAYTKQAMAIALSVALRCEPCLKMHMANALQKGFTQDEIDEAAWMGISFGGSPAMVFYEQLAKRAT
jgi:selenide, water dikinase